MLRKIILLIFVLATFGYLLFIRQDANFKKPAPLISGATGRKPAAEFDYIGEDIIYDIRPIGRAEYADLGMVDFGGEKLRLAVFRTQAIGFEDTEKIYSDPVTSLPVRVERDVSMWRQKEYLVEEYDQKNFILVIRKFKNNKKLKEYVFKGDGPISNAVILPFSLRRIPELQVGWSTTVNFPYKFELNLVSIEDIEVPAGRFKAYYLTSKPKRFEIWISQDKYRIPLKIKGTGGLGYTFVLKKHTLK